MQRTIFDCWKCRHHNSDNPYGIDYCEAHDTRCSFAHDACDNYEPDDDGDASQPRLQHHLMVALSVLLTFLLAGCKTKERIVTVETVRTDTMYITRHVRDSIHVNDSTHVSEQQRGDTIYVQVDRWRTQYVERVQHDTLREATHDTVPRPYPVIKEVPAELTPWQRLRLSLADIGLYGLLGWVAIWLLRRKIGR